jgi:large subunit ribosomal protein L6
MSRIGKMPIIIPAGVETTIAEDEITIKGPKGSLKVKIPEGVKLEKNAESNALVVEIANREDGKQRALWGLIRQLVANAVLGVQNAYTKSMEFVGVGFRVEVQGNAIKMEVGFSHPVIFQLPEGISASVEKNVLTISGIDKQQVGEISAQIRKIRPPEPYKGKGIKYTDEVIRRKAGKTASK